MLFSLRTNICVRFKPEEIAAASLYFAARRLGISLPENPPWWELFDTALPSIEDICYHVIQLYNKPKTQEIQLDKSTSPSSPSMTAQTEITTPVNTIIVQKIIAVNPCSPGVSKVSPVDIKIESETTKINLPMDIDSDKEKVIPSAKNREKERDREHDRDREHNREKEHEKKRDRDHEKDRDYDRDRKDKDKDYSSSRERSRDRDNDRRSSSGSSSSSERKHSRSRSERDKRSHPYDK